MPICEVVQPHLQDLFATILNQMAQLPKQLVLDLSVLIMTKNPPATNINAVEEVMTLEPSTVSCGVEACGKQVQLADLGNL